MSSVHLSLLENINVDRNVARGRLSSPKFMLIELKYSGGPPGLQKRSAEGLFLNQRTRLSDGVHWQNIHNAYRPRLAS